MKEQGNKSGEIYAEVIHAANVKILSQGPFNNANDKPAHDLIMLKSREMRRLWANRIKPRKHRLNQILELGIAGGGSIPYLFDLCDAEFVVGLDIAPDSPDIRQIIDQSALANRYELYFETDQSDRDALTNIVNTHFPKGLDLIVDDASHLLDLTRQSFEILFPKLKPGGLYVIEDYSWSQIDAFAFVSGKAYANQAATIQLLFEISMLLPSQKGWITRVSSDPYSITVQRGPAEIPDDFTLTKYINNWAGLDLDRLASLGNKSG